jgi:pyruvate dehydrogenase E2 component (dihydrolipoamide acetyltransferase)
VLNDQIVIRDMMNLSITADHRIVDGFQAAEFLQTVIQRLEHPGLFALEGSD